MTAILPKELLTATLGGLSLLVVSGGSDGDVLVQQSDGTYAPETLVTGDVFGPASSTDNAIARFDATTGKLLQNCVVTIGDTGNIAGLGTVSCGAITASGNASIASGVAGGSISAIGTGGGIQGYSHASIPTLFSGKQVFTHSWGIANVWGSLPNNIDISITGDTSGISFASTFTPALKWWTGAYGITSIDLRQRRSAAKTMTIDDGAAGPITFEINGTITCGAITASDAVRCGSLEGFYGGSGASGMYLFTSGAGGMRIGSALYHPSGTYKGTTGSSDFLFGLSNASNSYTGPDILWGRDSAGVFGLYTDPTRSTKAALTCGAITASGLVCMSIYTVATLPSASANAYKEANVSDALAPAMGVAVVGGGSVKTKVRSNGTDWTVCGI